MISTTSISLNKLIKGTKKLSEPLISHSTLNDFHEEKASIFSSNDPNFHYYHALTIVKLGIGLGFESVLLLEVSGSIISNVNMGGLV